VAPVTQSTIATDLGKSLNIHGNFPSQITFNDKIAIDYLPHSRHLRLGQILHPCIGMHLSFGQNLVAASPPNAVDVRQTDFYPLVAGNVDT
jgi:hypothetical protein